jgi:hypothetical protein
MLNRFRLIAVSSALLALTAAPVVPASADGGGGSEPKPIVTGSDDRGGGGSEPKPIVITSGTAAPDAA